jgi:putative ABC transport system permease protein
MQFHEALATALRGVLANKLRSALTMLGVVIGVASVISMLALGNGARAAVASNFRFLGADQVQISSMMAIDDGELVAAGEKLTYDDGLHLPEAAPLVEDVDMGVSASGKLRYGRTSLELGISGTTARSLENLTTENQVQPVGWPEGQPLTQDAFLSQGRFFTLSEVLEAAPVCVLGYETAQDLFEGDNPIGEILWVNRQRCEVIGVLAELENLDESARYSRKPNETFFLPISTAIRMLYDEEPSIMITAHVSDEARMEEAKVQIADYLRRRHHVEKDSQGVYQDDFNITTRKDILGAQQEAANTFALLLAAMAVVSLIVGGIGIMNVMLVSVVERTHEVGVRMAVGARQRDILAQFLLEAAMISMAGGIVGLAVGVLSIPLAARLNQGVALLDPGSIPLSLAVALMTGILFGLYPAFRAARLDPIEALRYE